MMPGFTDNLFGKQGCSNRHLSKFFCQWWFSDCRCCLWNTPYIHLPARSRPFRTGIALQCQPHSSEAPARDSPPSGHQHLAGLTGEPTHCSFCYKTSCYGNASFGFAITIRKTNSNFTTNVISCKVTMGEAGLRYLLHSGRCLIDPRLVNHRIHSCNKLIRCFSDLLPAVGGSEEKRNLQAGNCPPLPVLTDHSPSLQGHSRGTAVTSLLYIAHCM